MSEGCPFPMGVAMGPTLEVSKAPLTDRLSSDKLGRRIKAELDPTFETNAVLVHRVDDFLGEERLSRFDMSSGDNNSLPVNGRVCCSEDTFHSCCDLRTDTVSFNHRRSAAWDVLQQEKSVTAHHSSLFLPPRTDGGKEASKRTAFPRWDTTEGKANYKTARMSHKQAPSIRCAPTFVAKPPRAVPPCRSIRTAKESPQSPKNHKWDFKQSH